MLFHSAVFLFLFLPITFALWLLADRTRTDDLRWLVLIGASLIFYGYFRWTYVILLLTSMAFNYSASRLIIATQTNGNEALARWSLTLSVAVNLGSLSIFKYADFIVGNINDV